MRRGSRRLGAGIFCHDASVPASNGRLLINPRSSRLPAAPCVTPARRVPAQTVPAWITSWPRRDHGGPTAQLLPAAAGSREQMSGSSSRSFEGRLTPPPSRRVFRSAAQPFARWVNELVRGGSPPGRGGIFCPTSTVTRGRMSCSSRPPSGCKFLVAAFGGIRRILDPRRCNRSGQGVGRQLSSPGTPPWSPMAAPRPRSPPPPLAKGNSPPRSRRRAELRRIRGCLFTRQYRGLLLVSWIATAGYEARGGADTWSSDLDDVLIRSLTSGRCDHHPHLVRDQGRVRSSEDAGRRGRAARGTDPERVYTHSVSPSVPERPQPGLADEPHHDRSREDPSPVSELAGDLSRRG